MSIQFRVISIISLFLVTPFLHSEDVVTSKEESKRIPEAQFKTLAEVLKNLDDKVSSEAAMADIDTLPATFEFYQTVVTVSDKEGNEKELLSVPETFKVVPYRNEYGRFIKLINLETGVSESQISIPASFSSVSVRSSVKQKRREEFKQKKGESRLDLYGRLTNYVQSVYVSYQSNPYMKVSGFSVQLGIPPSVTIDFEFKE